MTTANTVPCIKCGKELENVMEDEFQPLDGTAFRTYGHYGSTVFDPMDGSWLEISVCDDCLKEALETRAVKRGQSCRGGRVAVQH